MRDLPRPVLVVGGYGYRNIGDEAILAGLLARLGPEEVTVVSRDPAATTRWHGLHAIGVASALPALLTHRSVVIGGGGLFGRDMGVVGRLLPAFGLFAALGRRVYVEGVDVDSVLSPWGRRLIPPLMRGAARVTVRDRQSVAILEGFGVHANLAPDLSTCMPAAPAEIGRGLLRTAGVDLDRPVVGVALAGVQPELASAAVVAAAGAMEALPDVQFCFIPMSRHPRVATHDDHRLARVLQAAQPRLAILEGEHHPADVLAAFGQLSTIVAMRYHAMLFAERAGVPLVPIAYAEKNLRWLAEHDLAPIPAEPAAVTDALRTLLGGATVPARRASRRRRTAGRVAAKPRVVARKPVEAMP